jgi:hypothetical protein
VPESRQRGARRRGTSRRNKTKEARARVTQAAQEQAERKKLSPEAHRRRRIFGWALVALAVLVGVTHWMEHLGVFEFASPGIEDLVAGYPLALLLGILGTIVLSR